MRWDLRYIGVSFMRRTNDINSTQGRIRRRCRDKLRSMFVIARYREAILDEATLRWKETWRFNKESFISVPYASMSRF